MLTVQHSLTTHVNQSELNHTKMSWTKPKQSEVTLHKENCELAKKPYGFLVVIKKLWRYIDV